MQWSKLRSRLLELTAPSLRKRVDFHLINYRKLSELANEFIVSIDGRKVFSASYSRYNIAQHIKTRTTGLMAHGDGPGPWKVEKALTRKEVHNPCDITSTIRTYLDIDPHIALTSSDPILRSLAMIDKRIGKRTLKSIELPEDEHSLVKTLYTLRTDCLD
jgi:hypothetical protein